ncbi:MAG: sigma-54-dependent Fis family transcriptional regulator [Gammaproteobacteria bacterium]|nr:sigma-54-dependent Fis family transcriptional regulator [Gammaproteobacteria bacterium]
MLRAIDNRHRHPQAAPRRTLRPEDSGTPEYIRRSWLRCLNQYHLDPKSEREPYVLPRQERLERKENNRDLLALADAEMAHLYHQLAGSGYSIILTDRDGVLLDYYGDFSFRNAAFRTGLVLGAMWDEEHGGTNGMGTCLVERTPLIVHREQHFFSRNSGLTCCAAPIFDYRGELIAVLDASGESDRAQQHTLVLVNMAAQMIENRLFLHHFRDTFVVRFHSRPELLGTWGEGIIALDANGLISALDRNALFQLGLKSQAELLGSPLERVFTVSLNALLARSQRKSFHPLTLYDAHHGGRMFAIAQAPQSKRAGKPHGAHPAAPEGLDPDRGPLEELDFGDPVMARNIQATRRTLAREIPILLIGESGTGKECFARALHASSERAEKPFVALHCGALTDGEPAGTTLAEQMRSRIVQANGGTLFLDDVGELPVPLQSQVLHLIEERALPATGGAEAVRIDVQLVSATRRDLHEPVQRGALREDLFYRLQGLVLTLPPLRERKDKAAVIRHIFAQESAATPAVSMGEDMIDALKAYSWPGNIRQLRNVLRGMIAMRSNNQLDAGCLPAEYGAGEVHTEEPVCAEAQRLNPLERAERSALLHEIELHQGNLSRVAQSLGIGRNTLYRNLRRLHISLPVRR